MKYIKVLMLLFVLLSLNVCAQLPIKYFQNNYATDLFDERGFSKNNPGTGNSDYSINPVNGNLMYNYLVSSTNVNDAKLNLTLTFNANTKFTSYGYYNGELDKWTTMDINKGCWIIGVNGFAIQTTHIADNYFTDPAIENAIFMAKSLSGTGRQNKQFESILENSETNGEPGITSYFIDKLNLNIEGYDVCNRMCLINNNSNSQNRDFINILRSDGSILKLVNEKRCLTYVPHNNPSEDEELYVGKYYEEGLNTNGFGIVEYMDLECYQTMIDDIICLTTDIPIDHENDNKTGISHTDSEGAIRSVIAENVYSLLTADKKDLRPHLRPRRLRYFPGDGYEYVFTEHPAPFGYTSLLMIPMENYMCHMDDMLTYNNTVNENIGGSIAYPTIFYLDAIYHNGAFITNFAYRSHINDNYIDALPNKMSFKNERGRARVKGFANHNFVYSNNLITIDRTTFDNNQHNMTEIYLGVCDRLVYEQAPANETESTVFLEEGYKLSCEGKKSKVYNFNFSYSNYTYYVSKILETQNGTKVLFQYNKDYRGFFDVGFPFQGFTQNGLYDPAIGTSGDVKYFYAVPNFQLTRIKEQDKLSYFTYHTPLSKRPSSICSILNMFEAKIPVVFSINENVLYSDKGYSLEQNKSNITSGASFTPMPIKLDLTNVVYQSYSGDFYQSYKESVPNSEIIGHFKKYQSATHTYHGDYRTQWNSIQNVLYNINENNNYEITYANDIFNYYRISLWGAGFIWNTEDTNRVLGSQAKLLGTSTYTYQKSYSRSLKIPEQGMFRTVKHDDVLSLTNLGNQILTKSTQSFTYDPYYSKISLNTEPLKILTAEKTDYTYEIDPEITRRFNSAYNEDYFNTQICTYYGHNIKKITTNTKLMDPSLSTIFKEIENVKEFKSFNCFDVNLSSDQEIILLLNQIYNCKSYFINTNVCGMLIEALPYSINSISPKVSSQTKKEVNKLQECVYDYTIRRFFAPLINNVPVKDITYLINRNSNTAEIISGKSYELFDCNASSFLEVPKRGKVKFDKFAKLNNQVYNPSSGLANVDYIVGNRYDYYDISSYEADINYSNLKNPIGLVKNVSNSNNVNSFNSYMLPSDLSTNANNYLKYTNSHNYYSFTTDSYYNYFAFGCFFNSNTIDINTPALSTISLTKKDFIDAYGNVLNSFDNNNNLSTFVYDIFNRIARITLPGDFHDKYLNSGYEYLYDDRVDSIDILKYCYTEYKYKVRHCNWHQMGYDDSTPEIDYETIYNKKKDCFITNTATFDNELLYFFGMKKRSTVSQTTKSNYFPWLNEQATAPLTNNPAHNSFENLVVDDYTICDYYDNETSRGNPSVVGYAICILEPNRQQISQIDSLYFEFSINPFHKDEDVNLIDNSEFTLDIELKDKDGNNTTVPSGLTKLLSYKSPLFLFRKSGVEPNDSEPSKQKIVLIPGLLNQIEPAISITDLIEFLNSGNMMQIAIKMVTPGKRISGNELSCIVKGIILHPVTADNTDFTKKFIYADTWNDRYKPFKTVINKIDDRSTSMNYIHNPETFSRFFKTDYTYGYNYNIEKAQRNDIDYNNDQISEVQYNLLNQKIKETGPMGTTNVYNYDEFFRLKKLTTSTNNIELKSEVKYFYKSLGSEDIANIVDLKNPYYYPNDDNITIADIENNEPSFYGSGNLTTSIIEIPDKSDKTIINYIKNNDYKDALGNLRVSIKEYTSTNIFFNDELNIYDTTTTEKTSKMMYYEYDNLNRIIEITNPENQYIRYWYEDILGKVKYKYQPDLGFNSYRYDRFGNLRFTQTQKQAVDTKMTFYQYDDLNRITVVGEAKFNNTAQALLDLTNLGKNQIKVNNINLNRISDQIEPNYLHYTGNTINSAYPYSILTVNPTMFQLEANMPLTDSTYYLKFGKWNNQSISSLFTKLNTILGTDCVASKFITNWNPAVNNTTGYSASTFENFEDIKTCPQNILIAYYYDELPNSSGNIFSKFPDKSVWNNLMESKYSTESSTVKIKKARNLKGRIATIAYRENGDLPFNYMVFSYDERGRVETMLRMTENIGIDATYYTYNSMDLVTSVRVVDARNQFMTYYGYDNSGRIDTVWDSEVISGGMVEKVSNLAKMYKYNYVEAPELVKSPPESPLFSLAYRYNMGDQLDSINIPVLKMSVSNKYNTNGWLTGIETKKNGTIIFEQNNTYYDDNLGNIQSTMYNNNGVIRYYNYIYDCFKEQMTMCNIYDSDDEESRISIQAFDSYSDKIGNRQILLEHEYSNASYNQYSYSTSKFFQPNALLSNVISSDATENTIKKSINNQYYNDGSLKNKVTLEKVTSLYQTNGNSNSINVFQKSLEEFQYDFRGLLSEYTKNSAYINDPNCDNALPDINKVVWKYAYNPFSERESKRMDYSSIGNTEGEVYPWLYYHLGINNEQYVTYNGVYNKDDLSSFFNSIYERPSQYNVSNGAVMSYASEYNIYAPGGQLVNYTINVVGDYKKTYKVLDQLGNTHLVLKNSEIVGSYLYEPFGKQITLFESSSKDRLSFIGKEKDIESSLGDFGVRKYDEDIGRFTSIDPLWEKYYSWTPYHYCSNNPVMGSDPSGLADYIYTSSDKAPKKENDWGFMEFLHKDRYFVEVNGKRFQANSKETVTQDDWKNVWTNWGTDKEKGLDAKVNDALSEHGKTDLDPIFYALKESPEGGLMDQKHNLIITDGDVDLRDNYASSSLYVYQGTVFNWREAGNVVWGKTMRKLGIDYSIINMAAHAYSLYKFRKLDQPNEVKAFNIGYFGYFTNW